MALLLSIKNLFVRLLSLLFGKTWIFITILGWFLILTGILFLFRPERARKKLTRMSFRPVKWILLIAGVYLAGIIISLTGKINSLLAFLLLVLIIVPVVILYFILKKKLFKQFVAWFSRIPVRHLRLFAVFQVAIGWLILILRKRIWF